MRKVSRHALRPARFAGLYEPHPCARAPRPMTRQCTTIGRAVLLLVMISAQNVAEASTRARASVQCHLNATTTPWPSLLILR